MGIKHKRLVKNIGGAVLSVDDPSKAIKLES